MEHKVDGSAPEFSPYPGLNHQPIPRPTAEELAAAQPLLQKSQVRALQHVTEYAHARSAAANKALLDVLSMSNISPDALAAAVACIKQHARVALHFHPDRPDQHLRPVAEGILETGLYTNQFETKISNGSVSALPGGARDVWEEQLFSGAYHLVFRSAPR